MKILYYIKILYTQKNKNHNKNKIKQMSKYKFHRNQLEDHAREALYCLKPLLRNTKMMAENADILQYVASKNYPHKDDISDIADITRKIDRYINEINEEVKCLYSKTKNFNTTV